MNKNIEIFNSRIKDKLNSYPRYKWQRRKLKGCKTPKWKFKEVIKNNNKKLEDDLW